jgi:hypothetical protein
MNIKKGDLKFLIEQTFYEGMHYGYSVDHENINESEKQCWKEYFETLDIFKTKKLEK